jgi:PTS system cellobiose-specific IIB component
MSSSSLVKRMDEHVTANGLTHQVEAMSVSEAKERLREFDVVLVCPQVRFELAGLRQIAEPLGIPVADIPAPTYAGMKGVEVIKLAESLVVAESETAN